MTNLPHFPVSVFRDAGFILPVRAASKMKPERVRRFPLFPVMGPAASSGAAKRRFLQRPPARFLFSARRTDGCATAMHPSGTGIQSPDTGRHNIFPFPPGLSFFSVCSGTLVPPRHGAIRHNPVSCHAPQRRSCPIFSIWRSPGAAPLFREYPYTVEDTAQPERTPFSGNRALKSLPEENGKTDNPESAFFVASLCGFLRNLTGRLYWTAPFCSPLLPLPAGRKNFPVFPAFFLRA